MPNTQTSIEAKMRGVAPEDNSVSQEELAAHGPDSKSGQWLAINGDVYDITKFARLHPGGEEIIKQYAGKDATEAFFDLHRYDVLRKYHDKLYVGKLAGSSSIDVVSADMATISDVPYAESTSWRDGWNSPFYNESHKQYRITLRKWLNDNICEEAQALAATEKEPTPELHRKLGAAGLYAARLGPGPWLNGRNILGVRGEDFDYFHEMITHEEWSRITGTPSIQDGLGTGLVIGLPPVLLFGTPEIQEKVGRECLNGEKTICLAISEPFAGSDVANIQCTAKLNEEGTHYIVSGVKKWITNGTFCDYFVCAVRTGDAGIGGISMLLVERSEGLTTKAIKTSYGSSAGTAYVIMEKVKVPVGNLLGGENAGFQCIMSNFNHERWFICCLLTAAARSVVQECFKWSMQRKVFGKKLISQPVVRQKLAIMISQVESVHSWLEILTYQMCTMDKADQFFKLGGPIALLKMIGTRMSYDVSDHAVQIFGGRAITKGGMGKYVEEFQRSIKYGAILGGSEEVMADLGIRLAQREFPSNAKL